MKGYLLDTNVILIAPENPGVLSQAIQAAILDGPNYLSVISYWEVMIKSMKGNLIVGDPRVWWRDVLEELAAVPLLLLPQHIDGVANLPPIHKDPFDRMLICQALTEPARLLTADRALSAYSNDLVALIE